MGTPPKRPPKRMDPEEVATILSFGDLHDDKAAAAKFGVKLRTIQRYRKAIREGRAPELAALVAKRKVQAVERHADLLTDAYEAGLKRMRQLLPTAEMPDTIRATQMLGELVIQRDLFLGDEGDDDEGHAGARRPDQSAEGDAPGATRTTH